MRASFTTEIYCLNSSTASLANISINYSRDGNHFLHSARLGDKKAVWHEPYSEANKGFTSKLQPYE